MKLEFSKNAQKHFKKLLKALKITYLWEVNKQMIRVVFMH